jgi:hypothetical protein
MSGFVRSLRPPWASHRLAATTVELCSVLGWWVHSVCEPLVMQIHLEHASCQKELLWFQHRRGKVVTVVGNYFPQFKKQRVVSVLDVPNFVTIRAPVTFAIFRIPGVLRRGVGSFCGVVDND